MEKKPLYHFLPGSPILSIGTAGCNLACRFCQNASLVYADPKGPPQTYSPERLTQLVSQKHCHSIAFTYNEPTVYAEYALATARLCKQQNLSTVMVTNGYISKTARQALYEYIDAANVDLKAFDEDFYKTYTKASLAPVLETIADLRRMGVWVELTTLLIPGLNDDDDLLSRQFSFLVAEHGPDVVLHLSAFHPTFKMKDRPRTPLGTLQRARHIAAACGLHYVYVGNVYDPDALATCCHQCGKVLVSRNFGEINISTHLVENGTCTCGTEIAGIWQ